MAGPGATLACDSAAAARLAAHRYCIRSRVRTDGAVNGLGKLLGAHYSVDLIRNIAARLDVEKRVSVLDGAESRLWMGGMTRGGINSVLSELGLNIEDGSEIMRGLGTFCCKRWLAIGKFVRGREILFSELVDLFRKPELKFEPSATQLGDLVYGHAVLSERVTALQSQRGITLTGIDLDPANKLATIVDPPFDAALAQFVHLLDLWDEGRFKYPVRAKVIEAAAFVKAGRAAGLLG